MKKLSISLSILALVLFGLYADYGYSGSAVGYSSASATMPMKISASTWLKTGKSTSDNSYVKYGFYTKYNEVSTDDTSKITTLTITESYLSTNGDVDTYSASGKFTVYFYIISNSSCTAKLTCTQLKREESNDAGPEYIKMYINGATEYPVDTGFDPTGKAIYGHSNVLCSVTTDKYEITSTKVTEALTYKGTITLELTVS